jgi:hypothetical protein
MDRTKRVNVAHCALFGLGLSSIVRVLAHTELRRKHVERFGAAVAYVAANAANGVTTKRKESPRANAVAHAAQRAK